MGSITEENIKDTTDALISSGLAAAGYNYLNLDDDWAQRNSTTGKIMADPTKWTDGSLKTIADYVHSKNLKFGTCEWVYVISQVNLTVCYLRYEYFIDTDRGVKTCGGRPAAQGHEDDDAAVYASWGVGSCHVQIVFLYSQPAHCHGVNSCRLPQRR
jgi:alpha-galactosidase